MRAQLLLTALMALPMADDPPQVPDVPDVTVISTALLKTMAADNLQLRQAVLDMRKERDEAIENAVACVAGRSA